MKQATEKYDFIVVGGGMSGMCAAIAAARLGVRTALVQDRPVLGGNASSEIRMHICGADKHGTQNNARETGIIEELLLKNRYLNPQHSFSVQDAVFWDCVSKEENLDLYLNARVLDVDAADGRIRSVRAVQMTTETEYTLFADFFADATGDGFVGFAAGAQYMYGREGRNVFDEPDAPAQSDSLLMGSSIMFSAKDMGRPVPFIKPDWAYTYTESDLENREHSEITSGYWWLEVSGDLDVIDDAEKIRDELLRILYGVWDHVKNQPGHRAENYALDWVGAVPGRRESRRLTGDYVLTEQDVLSCRAFADVVAYGGWDMDVHVPKGFLSLDRMPTTYYMTKDLYGIPYRCLYSRNIENLFLAGRAISASHIAFGSTRVMGTCAVVGQAVGTAAAVALSHGLRAARAVGGHIEELQQTLLKYDCYLPGKYNTDTEDLARDACVSATSHRPDCEPQKVISGCSRDVGNTCHRYVSQGIAAAGERLTLTWSTAVEANEVIVRFDSNLRYELTITQSDRIRSLQRDFPVELVRDFDVELYAGTVLQKKIEIRNNIQRSRYIGFDKTTFDKLTLVLYNTYGAPDATVFEVRVYNEPMKKAAY